LKIILLNKKVRKIIFCSTLLKMKALEDIIVDARSDHTSKALRRAGHRRTESIGEELEPI
jgi:Trk K+ transport system NAD-binding subunit